ncbi:MAG: hypothetical protein AB7V57_18675 [Verrucomicrobiales bacterium]
MQTVIHPTPHIVLAGLFSVLCVSVIGSESPAPTGKNPRQPLGEMSEPLSSGLDFGGFNKPGVWDPRETGQILYYFDHFLAAQGIAQDGSPQDLVQLRRLLGQDLHLVKEAYTRVKAIYDPLDDEIDAIEDAFVDLKDPGDDNKDDE